MTDIPQLVSGKSFWTIPTSPYATVLVAYIYFIAAEIDNIISRTQNNLQQLSRSHPRRQADLFILGRGLLLRYTLSGSNDDLERSIQHLTEASLLRVRVSDESGVNITDVFSHLVFALLQRSEGFLQRTKGLLHGSERSSQLGDVNFAIQCLRCLRGQTLDNSSFLQNEVMIHLIEALAIGAILGSTNGTQDITEMITICDELLTSDISEEHSLRVRALHALQRAISAHGDGNRPFLDQCIKHLREVCTRWPNSPVFAIALAESFVLRFDETLADGDFEEATTILNRFFGSSRPENSLDEWQQLSLGPMILLATIRAVRYENPEYVEEVMHHLRTFRVLPSSSSRISELRHNLAEEMEDIAGLRFEYLGVKEASAALADLPRRHFTESHAMKAPRLMEVDTKIRDIQVRLSTILPGTSDYRQCLEDLADSYYVKFSLTNELTDIKEAIKYCRLWFDSIPSGGVSSCNAAISLAKLLKVAFDRTESIECLNESIDLLTGVLKLPAGQVFCKTITRDLTSSLYDQHQILHGTQDPHDPNVMQALLRTSLTVVEIFRMAADNKFTSVSDRLRYSCVLAELLWRMGSSPASVSTAYEKAMSLLQDSVIFVPNLQLQHTYLVAIMQVMEDMPSGYASHLVHTGQLERAIETLERGRALLWSELRGFRTSIHHIAGVDPLLAEKFTAINQDLEKLTVSFLPTGGSNTDGYGAKDGKGVDHFGHLLAGQRKLLEERDSIISHVRSLPGSQSFLMESSFDTLRSAASHGPVIIINHSEWRSDILILLHDAPPSLIPTSEGFYDEANRLKDDLLEARKKRGLDSREYDRTLASILEDLYNLIGRPIIERLHELKIPEQSRVWWCPTSIFCSLPLHAMGPIPSNDGQKRYFSDLYIPSYTPTLSALIESRNPNTQSSRKPSLLLVAQPDKTLLGVRGETRVIEGLDIEVESLILKDATTRTVLEGLRRHELVHFACHGELEMGKPFDASFKLHRGQRLKLLDIVNSRLPNAEFAFLSACHTAELTEESIANEGLHLTAALQYCGFRSVIGTMWAMADTDGRDLARRVYRSMLSGKDEGPCYLSSAAALRDAVKELRNKNGVSLERWVNFVHYGA